MGVLIHNGQRTSLRELITLLMDRNARNLWFIHSTSLIGLKPYPIRDPKQEFPTSEPTSGSDYDAKWSRGRSLRSGSCRRHDRYPRYPTSKSVAGDGD